MSIKSTKSTKRETSDFISFRCFYKHKKCCSFCVLVCVFMFFMSVKFSRKKKIKSKIGPDNLHYHTTSGELHKSEVLLIANTLNRVIYIVIYIYSNI